MKKKEAKFDEYDMTHITVRAEAGDREKAGNLYVALLHVQSLAALIRAMDLWPLERPDQVAIGSNIEALACAIETIAAKVTSENEI